ncbi:hypothetical protein assk_159 [Aeromonas phage Assk]|nr:hypothetical protein assk_159 [Aeromonas phage Assk]
MTGKWQTPGRVMTKIIDLALENIGYNLSDLVVHSYKDEGDCILVNLEFKEGGDLVIQRTRLVL